MDASDHSIEAHFQACITAAFTRAERLKQHGRIAAAAPPALASDLQSKERWLKAIERVRTTLYTRRSVDRITREHREAWSVALIGKDELTARSFLRGDTFNPAFVDDVTKELVSRVLGHLVLATPTIPWHDRLTWPARSGDQASINHQAWRYWRYGEIVRWLTDPITHITVTERHLSLLIGVVLAHFGEEFTSGNGPETAAHWLNLLDTLGDGIMPVAYSSRAKTLTLARWQDLESRPLPS